jgi:hypothetical protein
MRISPNLRVAFVIGLQAVLAVSCNPNAMQEPSAGQSPTTEPVPTATHSPTAAPTAVTLYPVDTPTAAPSPYPEALYVQADQPLGEISPLIYGTNYGPWQNLSRRVTPDLQAAGIRLLRYPGGAWGDEYTFVEGRLDEFVELAEDLGAEPMVNVKLKSATPESAAKVVRYANIEKQYGIRYWAIGNEPDLYGMKYQMTEYDTETFNREWRALATAMREVDPSILLIGPETSQFTGDPQTDPADRAGRDWLRAFLRANGDLVDIVSVHRYPFGATDVAVSDLRDNSAEWDMIIPRLRYIIYNELGRDLPVAVTEVNSNWSNREGEEATPDSFYNAVWYADVLGRLARQRVDLAAHFCLEGAGGLGMTSLSTIRPIKYIFDMYSRFGSELVYASSDTEYVYIYAAKTADGSLTLMVVNMDSKDIPKMLRIEGMAYQTTAETWRFDSMHNAEQIADTAFHGQTTVDFPAESVTLFILRQAVP